MEAKLEVPLPALFPILPSVPRRTSLDATDYSESILHAWAQAAGQSARTCASLSRAHLVQELRRRFGSEEPLTPRRRSLCDRAFTAYVPRGTVGFVHGGDEATPEALAAVVRELMLALLLGNRVHYVGIGAAAQPLLELLNRMAAEDPIVADRIAVSGPADAMHDIGDADVVISLDDYATSIVSPPRNLAGRYFQCTPRRYAFLIIGETLAVELRPVFARAVLKAASTAQVDLLLEHAVLEPQLKCLLGTQVPVQFRRADDPTYMLDEACVGILVAANGWDATRAAMLARLGCNFVADVGSVEAAAPLLPIPPTAYARAVQFHWQDAPRDYARLPQRQVPPPRPAGAVLDKTGFTHLDVAPEFAQLYFKSGGSCGEAKLSIYAYDDFDAQQRLGAEGLLAAGLDPLQDRCLNAFSGGGLYGAFPIFCRMLEHLRAVQFPMMTHDDLAYVAQVVVTQRINTILGMPSYIMSLMRAQTDTFKRYGGIKKIFFAGEPLTAAQQRYLHETFAVELIKSAAYGSVDTGPVAFQCAYCSGGVHHLHPQLQQLEILALDADREVPRGEVGRLIFSSRLRYGQSLRRYDVGDLGRWVDGPCACGREAPRFEVLGRHGDVFKIGGATLNYHRFATTLAEHYRYAGATQIELHAGTLRDRLNLKIDADTAHAAPALRAMCLAQDRDLADAVLTRASMDFTVEPAAPTEFAYSPVSGKLLHIIDRRPR